MDRRWQSRPFSLGKRSGSCFRIREFVVGLDVGLDAVKSELSERSTENEANTFCHVAAAFMRGREVIAEVGALEGPAHDLIEIHDADQISRFTLDEPVADMGRASEPRQVGVEGLRRSRRARPLAMESATSPGGGEELSLEPSSGFLDLDGYRDPPLIRRFWSSGHRLPAAILSSPTACSR